MKTYARIAAGAVVELLHTPATLSDLFHPALRWVEITDPAVAIGWVQTASGLAAPPVPQPQVEPPPPPTLAALQAQIAELAARVEALAPR